MAEGLVLVNGLPGAGKTALARMLSRALGATVFSKDGVKEAVAEVTDRRAVSSVALGAAAMELVWTLLRMLGARSSWTPGGTGRMTVSMPEQASRRRVPSGSWKS